MFNTGSWVVTMDAGVTEQDLAKKVVKAGGHFLMQINPITSAIQCLVRIRAARGWLVGCSLGCGMSCYQCFTLRI
jgi:hypothetical protein